MLNLRRLTHAFADGSLTRLANFGRTDAEGLIGAGAGVIPIFLHACGIVSPCACSFSCSLSFATICSGVYFVTRPVGPGSSQSSYRNRQN